MIQARAAYAERDIYLLDDPLSAVDAHVGRHIFDNVIGPKGLLRKCTRIFVTHSIQYLQQCSSLIALKSGSIVEGPASYSTLMAMEDGHIARLMNDFMHESHSKDELKAKEFGASTASLSSVAVAVDTANTTPSSDVKPPCALISSEESAKGSVTMAVYWTYAKACSLVSTAVFLGIMVVSQLLSISSNVWLENWSSGSQNNVALFLGVYGGLGCLFAVMVVVQVVILWVYCAIRSARTLHDSLLHSILKAPTSFFDTTPLGRIVNRFSKDIYTIDEVSTGFLQLILLIPGNVNDVVLMMTEGWCHVRFEEPNHSQVLPRSFQGYFRTLFMVVSIIAVISFSTPLFMILILPLGFLYSIIQRYYLASSRELKRLDSTSRSPMCLLSAAFGFPHHPLF